MPHDYPCDWKSGFTMDPNKKQRVGYLVDLKSHAKAFGDLAKDIKVFCPFNGTQSLTSSLVSAADPQTPVVVTGVLDNFSFGGAVGDPICISGYISAENAKIISAKLQATLGSTFVSALSWVIFNYNEEKKEWFEEAYPLAAGGASAEAVTGQFNAPPGGGAVRLTVATDATKIAPTIDVNVYNIYFEVVPAANKTHALGFATTSTEKLVRNWGLQIGTLAAAVT